MKKILKRIIVLFGACLGLGVIVSVVEKMHGRVGWVEGYTPYGFYEKNVKRALDFGLSLMALIFLLPVMAATGIAVCCRLGTPVIFRQERPGLGGKIFTIRKFRTMRDGGGSDGERLTDFGKKLRAASIDELPELVNILKGEMSIVGPRPLLAEYLPRYNERQAGRHDVRPGLTGLAQVSGRNAISWEERLEDDVRYTEKITFFGDMKIMAATMITVLRKEGISDGTSATMKEFTGSGVCQ